jgi:hypothetical protein
MLLLLIGAADKQIRGLLLVLDLMVLVLKVYSLLSSLEVTYFWYYWC